MQILFLQHLKYSISSHHLMFSHAMDWILVPVMALDTPIKWCHTTVILRSDVDHITPYFWSDNITEFYPWSSADSFPYFTLPYQGQCTLVFQYATISYLHDVFWTLAEFYQTYRDTAFEQAEDLTLTFFELSTIRKVQIFRQKIHTHTCPAAVASWKFCSLKLRERDTGDQVSKSFYLAGICSQVMRTWRFLVL